MTHKIDLLVGERIREIRQTKGISQEALAAKIGITYQQLQKYEKAENRISASRLFDLAYALKTPISSFFDQSTQPLILDKAIAQLIARFSAMTPAKQKLVSKLVKEL